MMALRACNKVADKVADRAADKVVDGKDTDCHVVGGSSRSQTRTVSSHRHPEPVPNAAISVERARHALSTFLHTGNRPNPEMLHIVSLSAFSGSYQLVTK